MHTITFYPLGNADSYLIELKKGKNLLFDFANVRDPRDKEDRRIDLEAEMRKTLGDKDLDYIDVVAFTHLDDDHIHGASEFFYLELADKYQTKERIKIRELWVPAAAILEPDLDDEARILRQEARHRLIKGKGIRVFSRPEALADWLKEQNLTLESRKHLITNAGQLVPGFDKIGDGIEFFVHSPFSKQCDDEVIDRNDACLGFQATFDTDTQLLMTADATHEIWGDIVEISESNDNESRLAWDILKIPHHCSYLSLGPDKGKTKTKPTKNVKWLLEQGKQGAVLVVTSKPIPSKDEEQPPHHQAFKTYDEYRETHNGKMYVTMEWPTQEKPEKLVINIDSVSGATVAKRIATPSVIVTGRSSRAGSVC